MFRRRCFSTLVLGAFGSALTLLPWLHTLDHRDDHVHVDGAIVYLQDDHDDDHDHHTDDHDHHTDDAEHADESAGFDHPEHHGPHARGALAHGAAFILAGAIFLFPPPSAALERLPRQPRPEQPALVQRRSSRVTRGPPSPAHCPV